MKVAFKLNRQQARIAKRIKAEVFAREQALMAANPDVHWGRDVTIDDVLAWNGNMMGHCEACYHYHYNDNQHLEYNRATSELTYTGERHPMRQDGAGEILARITGAWKEVHLGPEQGYVEGTVIQIPDWCKMREVLCVVEYRSSVAYMYWTETMSDYLERETDTLKLFQYTIDKTPPHLGTPLCMYLRDVETLIAEYKERGLDIGPLQLATQGRGLDNPDAKACHQLHAANLAEYQRLAKQAAEEHAVACRSLGRANEEVASLEKGLQLALIWGDPVKVYWRQRELDKKKGDLWVKEHRVKEAAARIESYTSTKVE